MVVGERHKDVRGQLRDAERGQRPVRIDRRRGAWHMESIHGFVVGLSPQWVAVQSLIDGVYVDGYDVVRIDDVSNLEYDDENGYIERAIAQLGRPAVDFSLPGGSATREVLRAAAAYSPTICVHLEMDVTDPMLVGSITSLGARKYEIRLINPSGVWDSELSRWWYGEVTRIRFGDRYSTALQKFGDPLPATSESRETSPFTHAGDERRGHEEVGHESLRRRLG